MKKILLLAVIVILGSCNKTYKYVETVKEKSLFGNSYEEKDDEPETISAPNDSIAYLEAYEKFCISVKARLEVKKQIGETFSIPTHFTLYNSENEEVNPYINPETLNEIEERIMSLGMEKPKVQEVRVDSAKIKELSPFFDFKKDEFDPKGTTWISPKSRPKYVNRNGMYCYFSTTEGELSPIRFQIQYYADDWLFIRKYQFSIDGNAYELIPDDVETDHSGGKIWEWCDQAIRGDDMQIIKALAGAKSAKIKFVGRQYSEVKTITSKELESIKNVLDLYIAMGGSL